VTNYISNQKQIQMGEETTWGTNVAATVELSGIDSLVLSPSIVTEVVRAHRGGIVPGRDTVTARHEVQGCSIGGYVIYEQIPYWLNGLHFATEGTTRAYAAPTTAQVTPDLATLIVGYGDAVYNITSWVAGTTTFTWNWGEPLRFNIDLMGHSLETDAFDALDEAAATALTYATACQCTAYIDPISGGTMGATAMTNVMGGTISINPQRKYLKRVGSCYPAGVYDAPYWDVTGTLIMEADATSIAFADAIVAGATTKQIRIKFTNGLAAGDERSLTFDIAGIARVPSLMTDSDELMTVELQWEPIEQGDWTTVAGGDLDGYFKISSVCNDADLWA
jgi:hypothetical protein